MNKTLATIVASTVLGGLFGAYITVNYFLPQADYQSVSANNLNNQKEQIIDEQSLSALSKEATVIDVVDTVSPSVVSIAIERNVNQAAQVDPFFNDFNGWPFYFSPPVQEEQPNDQNANWQKVGGASGFIISSDGYILTNKHVVADSNARYNVMLNDGREFPAQVVGTDLFNDIGALKIDAQDLPVVNLGDSDQLVIGQTVVAIGNALAEFSNTVTTGVVSGIGRSIVASDNAGSSEKLEDVIQTDAAINPGNSGGPLLNLSGQVVGINTAISSQGQLIGFAIPINSAKSIIEGLQKTGTIVRPYLGVRYMMLNQTIAQQNNLSVSSGALIVRGDDPSQLAVVPGSPADKAGLLENDIILAVDGQELSEDYDLAQAISRHQPDEKISLKVWSKGETKNIEVTLEQYNP